MSGTGKNWQRYGSTVEFSNTFCKRTTFYTQWSVNGGATLKILVASVLRNTKNIYLCHVRRWRKLAKRVNAAHKDHFRRQLWATHTEDNTVVCVTWAPLHAPIQATATVCFSKQWQSHQTSTLYRHSMQNQAGWLSCQEGNFKQWIDIPFRWQDERDMLIFGAQKIPTRSSSIGRIHQRWTSFMPFQRSFNGFSSSGKMINSMPYFSSQKLHFLARPHRHSRHVCLFEH